MWQFEFSPWLKGAPTKPALTPPAAALAAKRYAAREKGYVRALQNILCLPTGFPALMMWRSPLEIETAPGRTSIVTERFHLIEGGQKLVDDVTFADPAIYERPYTITLTYDRLPPDSERMEAVCEVDLEALKNIDLNSIKDVDPEAARLLDPVNGYNAAGTQADAASRAAQAAR
jgi:hypothetical protein